MERGAVWNCRIADGGWYRGMAPDATNKIDYIEFQAADIAATKKFFEQLFGWKFTDYGPDYTSFADGRIAGGFSRANKQSTIESGGGRVVFYSSNCKEIPPRWDCLRGKIP